jgi:putative transposase
LTARRACCAARLVPAGQPESLQDWAELLVARAREDGVALTGEGGLLTGVMRHVLQTGLEVEMAEHLGYGPHERSGRGSGNSRNGAYDKTVVTEIGDVDLRIPRDRNGTFEPAVVPKYQRRLDGLAGSAISLYAKGLTTGDIQQHLVEIYGTEVSRETISKITDQIVDDMVAWQSRPLDPLYAVLLIDCLVIKVRGSQVANRPLQR